MHSGFLKNFFEIECLRDDPPVLVDVGASGSLHPAWTGIAQYSVGVLFDGDSRDFDTESDTSSPWRRLIKIPHVISAESIDAAPFYLTRSPYCSSTLPPNRKQLEEYSFARLFDVVETVEVPTVSLDDALRSREVCQLDWLKIDAQGADLRVLNGLPLDRQRSILAIDLEPGTFEAYLGDDRLPTIMSYMESLPVFLSDMVVKGVPKVDQRVRDMLPRMYSRFIDPAVKISPGWCELRYLAEANQNRDRRSYLLLWLFSELSGQHGHAIRVALEAVEKYGDDIYSRCVQESIHSIRKRFPIVAKHIVTRVFARILGR